MMAAGRRSVKAGSERGRSTDVPRGTWWIGQNHGVRCFTWNISVGRPVARNVPRETPGSELRTLRRNTDSTRKSLRAGLCLLDHGKPGIRHDLAGQTHAKTGETGCRPPILQLLIRGLGDEQVPTDRKQPRRALRQDGRRAEGSGHHEVHRSSKARITTKVLGAATPHGHVITEIKLDDGLLEEAAPPNRSIHQHEGRGRPEHRQDQARQTPA